MVSGSSFSLLQGEIELLKFHLFSILYINGMMTPV